MIKRFLAAASAAILIAASVARAAGLPESAPATQAAPEIPAEIKFVSSVGDVTFPHQRHISDFGAKCADCHHQINAKPLKTPHPDYFSSSWINCGTCHTNAEKTVQKAYVCSACHQSIPKNIADETLSAKVVIHKQCWKCHAVGTGKDASKACEKCHAGKKPQ
jgi:uncharacterized CHY-type Zn-finger protein